VEMDALRLQSVNADTFISRFVDRILKRTDGRDLQLPEPPGQTGKTTADLMDARCELGPSKAPGRGGVPSRCGSRRRHRGDGGWRRDSLPHSNDPVPVGAGRFHIPALRAVGSTVGLSGLLFVYLAYFWGTTGRTLRKQVVGLRIVTALGQRQRPGRAALRSALYIMLSIGSCGRSSIAGTLPCKTSCSRRPSFTIAGRAGFS
jgi:RDD family